MLIECLFRFKKKLSLKKKPFISSYICKFSRVVGVCGRASPKHFCYDNMKYLLFYKRYWIIIKKTGLEEFLIRYHPNGVSIFHPDQKSMKPFMRIETITYVNM